MYTNGRNLRVEDSYGRSLTLPQRSNIPFSVVAWIREERDCPLYFAPRSEPLRCLCKGFEIGERATNHIDRLGRLAGDPRWYGSGLTGWLPLSLRADGFRLGHETGPSAVLRFRVCRGNVPGRRCLHETALCAVSCTGFCVAFLKRRRHERVSRQVREIRLLTTALQARQARNHPQGSAGMLCPEGREPRIWR